MNSLLPETSGIPIHTHNHLPKCEAYLYLQGILLKNHISITDICILINYLLVYGSPGSSLLSAGFLQLLYMCFSLRWLLWLWSMGSRDRGLQLLWCPCIAALWHMESSWMWNQTHVSALPGRLPTTEPPGKSQIFPF